MIQVASSSTDHGVAGLATPALRDLRRLATTFESAQTQRLAVGDQIRALARRGPGGDGRGSRDGSDLDALLTRVRTGAAFGLDPALGDAYRQYWNAERDLLRLLSERVAQHPTWSWLERVRGIGPSLAARLLARLEIERAPTPSSFWSYCGLATVAAEQYRCAICGFELSLPAGREVRPAHRARGTGQACEGSLEAAGDGPRRVAQPRPTRGESAPYDREAKKLCYLIGMSLVRQGEAYRRYYHEQHARLETTKPDWIARRRHLTALRMTEKLFLAHLWLVWRERLGLPVTAPYAEARDDASAAPRPWEMVTG